MAKNLLQHLSYVLICILLSHLLPSLTFAANPNFSFPSLKLKTINRDINVKSCQSLRLPSKLQKIAPTKANLLRSLLNCDSSQPGAQFIFSLVNIERSNLSDQAKKDLMRSRESYIIAIGQQQGQEKVKVLSRTIDGLIIGMTSLQQMYKGNNLWYGHYRDWPNFPIRIFQFKLSPITHIPSLKTLISLASNKRMNTFLINMSNDIAFKSLEGHYKNTNTLSTDAVKEVVDYAEGLGLHVVPEFNMITKGSQFIVGEDQLLEQPDGTYLPNSSIIPYLKNWLSLPPQNINGQIRPAKFYSTVKLNNNYVRSQFTEPLIDEILSLFTKARFFSLGGDEALGYLGASHTVGSGESVAEVYRRRLKNQGQKVLSKKEYSDFVNYINNYLNINHKKIKKLILAGDMFNHPDDYPHLNNLNGLDDQSGDASGEFGDILFDLPKNTMVLPWHYFQKTGYENNKRFNTIDGILESQLDTGAAIWYNQTTGRRFINYAKKKRSENYRVKVAMATNWLTYINRTKPADHTANKNFQTCKATIQYSGSLFW